MPIPNVKVFNELLKNLHKARTDDEIQAKIASLRADFENLETVNVAFVEERVKSPVSALKKYTETSKYQEQWDYMKDIIGLMVIVNDNDEVDKVIEHIVENYADLKNPYAENLFEDFRKHSIRKEEESESKDYEYQDPTGRNYQTTDGYKNAKANIMVDGFPVEIQIKTKEQYIAHFATHDPTYKSTLLGKKEKTIISDKLFPYFEASAYLRLNRENMTPEEIAQTRDDINEIMQRNYSYFQKHPKVFNDARITFGVYAYILLHRDEIMRDAVLESGSTSLQTTITELERVFKYTQKEIIKQNDSLTHNTSIPATLDKLMQMPYQEFKQIKEEIRGEFRMQACSVTGIFDGVTIDFVNMIKHLSDNYREVHVGVLSDDIVKSYLGKEPLYNQEQRLLQVENCKGVTSAYAVNNAKSKPQVKLSFEIEGTEPEPKPYDIAIAGGLFDGLHPGHQAHLRIIANSGEETIILVKSDKYSEDMKNKTPIFDQETRRVLAESQKGVTKTFITENDILPPQEVLDIMDNALENNQTVAIFMGSDWVKHIDEKPERSLKEMEFLKENYPNVILTSTDRPEKSYSSTEIREKLIEMHEEGDVNPYEITNLGESLV